MDSRSGRNSLRKAQISKKSAQVSLARSLGFQTAAHIALSIAAAALLVLKLMAWLPSRRGQIVQQSLDGPGFFRQARQRNLQLVARTVPIRAQECFTRDAALSQIFKLNGLPGDEAAFETLKELLRERGVAQMMLKPPPHHVGKVEGKARRHDKPDATELPEMIDPLLEECQQRGIFGGGGARLDRLQRAAQDRLDLPAIPAV